MNDTELISHILKGDERAFTLLIKKHQNLVFHIVMRMIRKQEDVEDICQEVFIKIFKNIKHFKGEAKLTTWIAKIAYNISLNHIRKDEKDALWKQNTYENCPEPIFETLPDTIFENKELKQVIIEKIKELPLPYRTVATLFYLEEFSYQEIEEITNIKQSTLRSHVSRARQMLKQELILILNSNESKRRYK